MQHGCILHCCFLLRRQRTRSSAGGQGIRIACCKLVFLFCLSGYLLLANIVTSTFVWAVGLWLEKVNADKGIKKKERKRKKKRILALGILALLIALILFKYLDFFGLSIEGMVRFIGIDYNWKLLNIIVPVGISYYTLEAVAYLSDVYWEKTEAEKKFLNMALFMSFFPKLVEGPITRYKDASALFEGEGISSVNLTQGYQRILWGLFKKLVIADQISPVVGAVFEGGYMDGGVALFEALIFTIQEYMDFSGAIDIAIGSARIFGVTLPENFRQPFFCKKRI